MNKFHINILLSVVISVTLLTSSLANADIKLYRYTNEKGVQVINSTIPAKYSQLGYEIINSSGEVLQRIPAAPTADAVEKANKEREMLANFAVLKRRYSRIEDIQRAMQRKLDNINASMAILKSNINNLKLRIDQLIGLAAEHERKGNTVPKSILNQLAEAKAELQVSEDLMGYREDEYRATSAKYGADIRAFIAGDALEKTKEEEFLRSR